MYSSVSAVLMDQFVHDVGLQMFTLVISPHYLEKESTIEAQSAASRRCFFREVQNEVGSILVM